MSEYYSVVNHSKKEYVDPYDFNEDYNLGGIMQGVHGSAIVELLLECPTSKQYEFGYWAGDKISVVGDSDEEQTANIKSNYKNIAYHLLAKLYERGKQRKNIIKSAHQDSKIFTGLITAWNENHYPTLQSRLEMKVLIVLTSNDKLGDTNTKTGFWLDEFATPYYHCKDNGVQITLTSPKGGQPPIEPESNKYEHQSEATRRLANDPQALNELANTAKLADMNAEDFDLVFYPGGRGLLWDLVNNRDSIKLLETCVKTGRSIATISQGSAVLLNAKKVDGLPIIHDIEVTGFSNSQEAALGCTQVPAFKLEDKIDKTGGKYRSIDDWQPLVQIHQLFITGQNPAAARELATALVERLVARRRRLQ